MKRTTNSHATHHAVALRYDEHRDEAPYVDLVASGAEMTRVLQLAQRYNIPVIEDVDMTRALAICEEDTAIPVSLYRAVAVVLQQVRNLLS